MMYVMNDERRKGDDSARGLTSETGIVGRDGGTGKCSVQGNFGERGGGKCGEDIQPCCALAVLAVFDWLLLSSLKMR